MDSFITALSLSHKLALATLVSMRAANASNLNGAFGVGMIEIIDVDNFTVQEVGILISLTQFPRGARRSSQPGLPIN